MTETIIKINSKPLDPVELKRLDKLEKEGIVSTGATLKDIRVQLNEQLKCLDGRLETQQGITSEFQDIFRRRADIEANYSRELDKLAKYITNRHKEQKQKRENWHLFSSMQVWDQLVSQTKRSSRDHSALAEIYANQIAQRCTQINEDLARVFKKCREIGYEIHEEVLKVLHELHTAMKTHHSYQSEFRQTENKLQVVEKQRNKLQQNVPPEKREKHKKLKLIEKEYLKRRQKYDEARLKATKARNEYLLCMDSANSSIQKYFVDDLSDLIDCMDFGFHQSLSRAVMMHLSGMDQRKRSLQQDIDSLNKSLSCLDSRLDKQRFIEFNNTAFMVPKKFEYTPVRRNETETVVQKVVLDDLVTRKEKLIERLRQLKMESEEIWKSMETAEKSLSDMVGCHDYDTTKFFVEEERASMREADTISLKQKSDRKETEEFYMSKFREYVLNSNRIARLQAKYDQICLMLGDKTSQNPSEGVLTLTRRPNAARRRRIGNTRSQGVGARGHPKLFGGSLEEYLEETNQDIPLIIRSCIRVINLFGLHHPGIFRVSGSQVEINNFRDAFERGEDPLADTSDASDINSVAGVLKLYLRELREPVFPIQYFDHFMELAQLESKHEFVVKVRDVVKTWPRPVFIVMRYLFAFLNHLTEFSDENLMDPYNLAICFGPTLVPIPEERDQVQFQSLVNELIKNFIIFHEDIFPSSVPGLTYEKYLTVEPDEMGEAPNIQEDIDADSEAMTEDDSVFQEESEKEVSLELFGKSEILEAQALYDFKARSSREVNFHKGDTIILFKQVSNDWWRGSVHGKEGLIPDKYIMLKIRGEDDRDRLESYRSIDESSSMTSSMTRERSASQQGGGGSLRERTESCNSDTTPVAMRRLPVSPASANLCGQQQMKRNTTKGSEERISPATSLSSGATKSSSATVISVAGVVAQSTRIAAASSGAVPSGSKDSLSQDSGNQSSPDNTSSATLTNNRLSSMTDSRSGEHDSLLTDDQSSVTEMAESIQSSTKQPGSSNTHIIRVTGPVTNLDDSGLVGRRESEQHETVGRSRSAGSDDERSKKRLTPEGDEGPRSRVPITTSLEAKLRDSQESLTSTGSNQELQHQLDSTIAQVEAFAQEIEKRKLSTSSVKGEAATERSSDVHAEKGRSVSIGGARPRVSPTIVEHEKPSSSVVLRQSSWGSRDHVPDPAPPVIARGHLQKQRSKEEVQSSEGQVNSNGKIRGGFRSNREFWEQRVNMRQKQTPDLVLDLPVSSSASASSSSATSGSKNSHDNNSRQPVPKPRTLMTSEENGADNFAQLDQSTIRKSSSRPTSTSTSPSTEQPVASRLLLFQSQHQPSTRPQVRVKPQIQSRKGDDENEKQNEKK